MSVENMNVQTFTSENYKLNTGLLENQRICAIGDVHGNDQQLAALLDGFAAENANFDKTTLVILGDLNDRGTGSLKCFDLAISAKDRFDDVITIQGNHEAILRIVIEQDRGEIGDLWNKHGGVDMMNEIGLENLNFSNKLKFKASMAENMGADRMAYLRGLISHSQHGNLLFVHAGTDPNKSLEEHFFQPWDQCFGNHWCWIREPFLQNPVQFPNLTVVHGHTPVKNSPYKKHDNLFARHVWQDGKLNLDGGSYGSGCVAAAAFTTAGYHLHCAIIYK